MFEEKYLQEVAPYRKRGPRNKRITNKKHKHNYIPINAMCCGRYLSVTTKCTICEHQSYQFFRFDPQTFDYDDYLNSIKTNIEFFKNKKKERRNKK
jgi:hypothetical protein